MKRLLGVLLSLSAVAGATELDTTELAPWFPPDLMVQPKITYIHQKYKEIAFADRLVRRHADDNFYAFSATVAHKALCFELETTFADTYRQDGCLDNVRLTLRKQLYSDIIGDPISLTAGLTLTQAFKHSLHDISSFHHGKFEGEFHLAAGKELSCGSFWMSRMWGVIGIGQGDRANPWIRADLTYERNWWDFHKVTVFTKTLWGLGPKNLSLPFKGYGPIAHQSIDIGASYDYQTPWRAIVGVEYAHRLYARNFPAYTNYFVVKLLYPIGAGDNPITRWLITNFG